MNLRLTFGVESGREGDWCLDRPGPGGLIPWGRRADITSEVSVAGRHGESLNQSLHFQRQHRGSW